MEKTKHMFEGGIYLIGNKVVAKNPLFPDMELQQFFLDKMEHYLSPICDILGYSLADDQFNLLLKLKNRDNFESYFLSKSKNVNLNLPDIPESTYIFSQAMANLQVSFVKHFNFRMKRSGTLMACRFNRKLVESQDELEEWIKILNSGQKLHSYAKRWSNDVFKPELFLTSSWLYKAVLGHGEDTTGRAIEHYLNGISGNLGSLFENLPPKQIYDSKSYFIKQFNRLFGPISSA